LRRELVTSPYRLSRARSSAGEFHARVVPEPAEREVWWHEVTEPALVLGSSQSMEVVDRSACEQAGVDVVRRRSGGGAVLLVPDQVTWLDVIVPAGAPGWSEDVFGPMIWLGRHLAAVIEALIDGVVTIHESAMVSTTWSRTVCFDGLGAGEVLLDGRKLVGISQRRTRRFARLQCCWYSAYDPGGLVELLVPEHRPPLGALSPVATLSSAHSSAIPALLADRLR
jgi:lipoate---protein ligase